MAGRRYSDDPTVGDRFAFGGSNPYISIRVRRVMGDERNTNG
jgi:hypothetical protein